MRTDPWEADRAEIVNRVCRVIDTMMWEPESLRALNDLIAWAMHAVPTGVACQWVDAVVKRHDRQSNLEGR